MLNGKLLFFLLSICYVANGQTILLYNNSGKPVNGDTILLAFMPGPDHGWTELSIPIYAKNTSSTQLTLGAKKAEYTIHADEYHSICFGGFCYDSSTFVSPYPSLVKAGETDSSFSGHYRFDDLLHVPNECLVSYTFYDINAPSDSAIVYVNYNTKLHPIGMIQANLRQDFALEAYPNPADASFQVSLVGANKNRSVNTHLILSQLSGELIFEQPINSFLSEISVNVSDLPEGFYFYYLSGEGWASPPRKLVILHH